MGASTSTLDLDDIEELKACSQLSQKEIKRLYKRFCTLDKDRTGRISTDEFLAIPELAMNPLAMRITAIFDSNNDDQVSFKQFVQTLAVFSPNASKEDKLRFAFKIYDVKGDGVIDASELFQVLKMMVGNHLSDDQLQTIVDKTMHDADKDKDGVISFEEFAEVLSDVDLKAKMSIRF